MKHIYKIDIEHSAPKDSMFAIAGYIITDSEEKIYNYLSTPETYDDNPLGIFTNWEFKEEINQDWKQMIIDCKGELGYENRKYENLYYGLTYYGWTDYGEINDEELLVLKRILQSDIVIID